MRAIFDQIIHRPGAVVPDLGRHPAGDSTALSARRFQAVKKQIASGDIEAVADEHGLPLPSLYPDETRRHYKPSRQQPETSPDPAGLYIATASNDQELA